MARGPITGSGLDGAFRLGPSLSNHSAPACLLARCLLARCLTDRAGHVPGHPLAERDQCQHDMVIGGGPGTAGLRARPPVRRRGRRPVPDPRRAVQRQSRTGLASPVRPRIPRRGWLSGHRQSSMATVGQPGRRSSGPWEGMSGQALDSRTEPEFTYGAWFRIANGTPSRACRCPQVD